MQTSQKSEKNKEMVKKRTDRTNDKKKIRKNKNESTHNNEKKIFYKENTALNAVRKWTIYCFFVVCFYVFYRFFFCFLLTKDYFLFIYCYYSFVFNIFCLRYSLFTYFTYFFNVWFLQQWERNICPIQEICVQLPWRLSNVIVFSKSLLVHFAAR